MRNLIRSFSCIIIFLLSCNAFAEKQCVILLHGLGRSHYSMLELSTYLKHHHYFVINENYPSTKKTIKSIAEEHIPSMINACLKNHCKNISFVTHSLGGIVLRQYLKNHKIKNLARIVMLAPPNHGSEVADRLHNNILFWLLTGPAGCELQTDKNSVPNRLPASLPYEVGIIAGNYSFHPFHQLFFNEANDGEVAISSTRLSNMKDFIILPVTHTFIMTNLSVMKQILSFLNHGKFIHEKI